MAITAKDIALPYDSDYGTYTTVRAHGKTATEATEKLKDKLCKITTKEERKHAEHLEWKAGIKETSFSRDQDCNPVVPRPKLFDEHP